MDYNGTIMSPVIASMFNDIFNDLIFEYGCVSIIDLYGYPLYLKGFDYVDNMSLKDYVHAKRVGWIKPMNMGKMFDVAKTKTGDWIFKLNLPDPEEIWGPN